MTATTHYSGDMPPFKARYVIADNCRVKIDGDITTITPKYPPLGFVFAAYLLGVAAGTVGTYFAMVQL